MCEGTYEEATVRQSYRSVRQKGTKKQRKKKKTKEEKGRLGIENQPNAISSCLFAREVSIHI